MCVTRCLKVGLATQDNEQDSDRDHTTKDIKWVVGMHIRKVKMQSRK